MGSVGEFKFSITQIIAGASYIRGNKWILKLGGGITFRAGLSYMKAKTVGIMLPYL